MASSGGSNIGGGGGPSGGSGVVQGSSSVVVGVPSGSRGGNTSGSNTPAGSMSSSAIGGLRVGANSSSGSGGVGRWPELTITKSPRIIQVAVGHEGQHAVLVSDEGAAFFVGTARRGEDGDASKL